MPTVVTVVVAATLGATMLFLFVRWGLGNYLQQKYASYLAVFNHRLSHGGAWYLLSVRLLPAIPFFVINIVSGFTKIPLATFVWTTFIGITPGVIAYAYAGKELASVRSLQDIISWRMLIVMSVLALLPLLPLVINRIRRKV